MTRLRNPIAIAAALSIAAIGTGAGAAAASVEHQADILENFPTMASGGADLLLAENTSIERSEDGVRISLKLPTPEPGSYTYPDTIPAERQAAPEAFTGWAFVFNHPEHCVTSETPPFCGPDDFNDQVKFGVYNFGGHASSLTQHSRGELVLDEASGGMVDISGAIPTGEPPRPNTPPDVVTFALENPMGAEIHAAIAPHGQLDPSILPGDMYNPTGNPGCECWWVGIFMPPEA